MFNTPNDKSLPGYLKIGWQVIGRAPVRVMPTGIESLPALLRARAPADLRPLESSVGEEPADVFGDAGATARLLEQLADPCDLATDRSGDYLRWRYGFVPLRYRVVLAGSAVEDGVAVFHLRRRGPATEATICDVLLPESGAVTRARRDATDRLRDPSGLPPAHRPATCGAGMAPDPAQRSDRDGSGRHGDRAPTLDRWSLSMGDVELFLRRRVAGARSGANGHATNDAVATSSTASGTDPMTPSSASARVHGRRQERAGREHQHVDRPPSRRKPPEAHRQGSHRHHCLQQCGGSEGPSRPGAAGSADREPAAPTAPNAASRSVARRWAWNRATPVGSAPGSSTAPAPMLRRS